MDDLQYVFHVKYVAKLSSANTLPFKVAFFFSFFWWAGWVRGGWKTGETGVWVFRLIGRCIKLALFITAFNQWAAFPEPLSLT